MKAILMHDMGGPEVLSYEDVPMPEPAEGQARVKLSAVGVNFVDVYYRKGMYKPTLPFILGQEGAGVVDALGAGVTEVKIGDRVAYASDQCSYAEYAAVPAWKLLKLPDGVSDQQGAAVLLQGLTAHYLTHSTFPLEAGQTALVHAAAGGAGGLLVQIAKLKGAHVVGTVSTEEKARVARENGADEVINYSKEDFEAEVKRLTDGKGVEVVYDSVGKDTFEKGLNCLRRRGMMVLWGQSSGVVSPFDPQQLNAKGSLFLTRPTLGHYVADRAELEWRARDLFDWIAAGKLRVRIDKTFPLANAADAQRYLESRVATGKVLLLPHEGH